MKLGRSQKEGSSERIEERLRGQDADRISITIPGGGFTLTDPIKIENPGTVPLANPAIEVYLTPAQLSFTGAVLVKRVRVRGTVPVGGTQQVNVGPLRVPASGAPRNLLPRLLPPRSQGRLPGQQRGVEH